MPVGVRVREVDRSLYTTMGGNSPVAAIIGTATKGPVNQPTLVQTQIQFKNIFGLINPKHFGTYAAQWYLAESAQLYYIRVADSKTMQSAEAKIKTIKESVENEAGIVLESNEVGSYYNGYAVHISTVDNKTSLKIVTREPERTLLFIKDVTLDKDALALELEPTPFRLKSMEAATAKLVDGVYTFENGNDGTDDEAALLNEMVTALQLLKDDVYGLDLMAMPGVSDPAAIQAALALCEQRGDTLFIADTPPNLDPQGVADWHNGKGENNHAEFNSSHGAMYYPWVYIYDEINAEEVLVPASVAALAAIARSENISRPWYAPAGLTRGLVRNIVRAERVIGTADADFLYEMPNNINSIITHQTAGLVLWGQRTLYRQDTALNRINVRRLITHIKRSVTRVCQSLVFEPNDRITWAIFEDTLNPFFRGLVAQRGIYDYYIVPLSETVTDLDIDNGRMPAQILIKPTKAAEFIPVDIVITNTGAELTNMVGSV